MMVPKRVIHSLTFVKFLTSVSEIFVTHFVYYFILDLVVNIKAKVYF